MRTVPATSAFHFLRKTIRRTNDPALDKKSKKLIRKLFWVIFTPVFVAIIATCIFKSLPEYTPESTIIFAASVITVASLLLLAYSVFKEYILKVAAYFDSTPDNAGHINTIRKLGIDHLRSIHASGQYDRIVIIGHSLGSVIGYDLIRFFWQEHSKLATTHSYRLDPSRQSISETCPWLITDFITLGSPLHWANILLSNPGYTFATRRNEGEFPLCPPRDNQQAKHNDSNSAEQDSSSPPCPQPSPPPHTPSSRWRAAGLALLGRPTGNTPLQNRRKCRLVEYVDRIRTSYRILKGQPEADCPPPNEPPIEYRPSPFGLVRWDNVFFTWGLFGGDMIGGPIKHLFGEGITDHPIKPTWLSWAHNSYWGKHNGRSKRPTARAMRIIRNVIERGSTS